jgi:hypothetical protein
MLLAVFTAAIPSSIAQPPGPPNPPVDITEGSSIRIYGEDNMGPYKPYDSQGQMYYDNWSDPFNPGILQKDSVTFNPAIILWDGQVSPMSANSYNIHEKKFLRMWYEPEHVYSKPGYCYPTIEVESTYMLVDKQDWTPTSGREDETFFKFPIVEIPTQTGLGAFENVEGEPLRPNVVTLAGVWTPDSLSDYQKTTNGHIHLEKTYTLMPGETIQFLDFKLQYRYIVAKNGQHFAKVKMWYAGNYEDDTEITTVLGQYDDGSSDAPYADTFFKRHMERYNHQDHANHVTWYARLEDEILGGQMVEITVGKDLAAGDTFYVNGVRYDISAIEVIKYPTDYEFKYITLRTPLPKGDGSEKLDDGKISSQWIVTVPPETALPLNPPFNVPYKMVDDINVVLWKPLKHVEQWPVGNPSGNVGTEYFPFAERYLTMQEPPFEWLYYFRAVPIDTDKDMSGLPTDWQLWDQYGPINRTWMVNKGVLSKWIAYDVNERLVDVNKPLQVVYIEETKEPRYSTDLLEVLNEYNISTPYLKENWTKFDIETLPDQYTEFVLPALPDVLTPCWNKTGDYLITTSFFAPNSIGTESNLVDWKTGMPRVAFAYDVDYELTPFYNRVEQLGDGLDLYVNQWGGSSTIRIYGDDNKGPLPGYGAGGVANAYPGWQDPFDPTSLQKDSITFNPAIVQWDGRVYPMSAQSEDIDVKAFLRLWYEPDHNYSKPGYKRPTIETETTYMLIDKQDKLPTKGSANDTFFFFPIAEDETTETPGLELIENPNSEPDRPNVVTLANVYGSTTAYNKTTNGMIWLQKTYKLDKGDKVQFLDHKLTFVGIVLHNGSYYAKVKVDYAGNREDDTGTTLVLATFNGGATYDPDPHRITWFKRHSETFRTPTHPHTTWYARLENYDPAYDWAEITVGKELQTGDVFYVDGVRYDIPVIEVIDITGDTHCEKFKYITIRTPFPKCILTGVPSVPDDGIISSQWIDCIAPYETLPVLPPFNMLHKLVDDIDVVLWEPLKHVDQWPLGDPAGVAGLEYFPCAERYLTMQYPPAEWLYYFRAVPIDKDNDLKMPNDWELWDHQGGPFYPGTDFPPYWDLCKCTKKLYKPTNYTVFDPNGWVALDMAERIIPEPYDPLVIVYVDELIEPRYSTNLLEILNETGIGTSNLSEQWGKYVIQTFPDLYTEFLLPKDEEHAGMFLMNDYLITTSFLAPNSVYFSDLVRDTYPRVAFVFDAFDSLAKTGLYVNELVQTPPDPENKAPVLVLDVDPATVGALETVTADTAGTYDDQYPLTIACDWKDGTVATSYWSGSSPAPVFTHEYMKSGVYTVTVTATDKYGASDVKTAPVTVTSDGAILCFNFGWNAISAPVTDSRSMSTLFVTTVPGFYAVYSWDNAAQAWVAEDLSHPLDPTKGYFVWATGHADVALTGTAAAYSPSFMPGWNLVGVGFDPVSVMSTYAYYYDHYAATYIPTHYMDPGYGYFIWM